MLIENGIPGITGLLDLAIVPIKSAFAKTSQSRRPSPDPGVCKIALMEEGGGGICVERLLFSGPVEAARSKAFEMLKAGRKMVLEGFPLEEIVAWCMAHRYRWRLHHSSCSKNAFILEPGREFCSDAKEAGAKH